MQPLIIMPNMPIRTCLLPIFLLALILCAQAQPAWADKDRPFAIHLPADILLPMVQKMLPLEFPIRSKQVQGDITVESLQQLSVLGNMVSIQGTFSGKNTAINTQFAGQDLQIKVGELRLALHCDLHLRFDAKTQKLYVKPHFQRSAGNDQDAMLKSLLAALNSKEFPVDMKKALEKLRIPAGDKTIPLPMEVAKIYGEDNTLILHLRPRK